MMKSRSLFSVHSYLTDSTGRFLSYQRCFLVKLTQTRFSSAVTGVSSDLFYSGYVHLAPEKSKTIKLEMKIDQETDIYLKVDC